MTKILLLLAFLIPPPLFGQDRDLQPSRFGINVNGLISQPREEFDRNVDIGFGAGGGITYGVDQDGWFSLRFDGGWLRYGHETRRVPFSETVGARILVDVDTNNDIVTLGGGPEFSIPHGPVRPYLNGGFHGVLFRTASSVRGIRSNDEEIASTTNLSDWTRAWVVAAGARIPIGGDASLVHLDLGVRYFDGAEARYLREGSIIDNPDGSITLNPLVSETPFVVYSVGLRFQIPRTQ
jgi:hypothetical protein